MLMRIARWLPLACVGLLMAGAAQPALATYIATENFDSAPAAWVGDGNRTSPQDFGWSNTNYAGGAAGEAGGLFSRGSLGRYDTNVGSLSASSDSLAMSGRGRFAGDSGAGDGNSILAWFDSTTSLGWVPDNYIGIRTDQDDVYLSYAANGSGETICQIGSSLGTTNSWSFTLSYDPNGNGGLGSITAGINGGAPVVQNLAAGENGAFTNLNRFGMITLFNGGSSTKNIYYDSLSYTSAIPEPGTLLLLLSGVIGIIACAWRRR